MKNASPKTKAAPAADWQATPVGSHNPIDKKTLI